MQRAGRAVASLAALLACTLPASAADMGEKVAPRKDFIKAEARKVQNLDI